MLHTTTLHERKPTTDATGRWPAPSSDFLDRIPRDFARRHLVLSAGCSHSPQGPRELLRVAPTTPPLAIHNTSARLGRPCDAHTDDPQAIAIAIDRAVDAFPDSRFARASVVLGSPADRGDEVGPAPTRAVDELIDRVDRDLLSTIGKAPLVQLTDALLLEALGARASDIHLLPMPDAGLVMMRIDGILRTTRTLSLRTCHAVAGRLKVISGMDVAEHRLAQDGRATVTIGSQRASRSVDLRVASLPTRHGERIVVRLLETAGPAGLLTLTDLGMPPHVHAPFSRAVAKTEGIVLVTGPTGSGKTTTLYAALRAHALAPDAGLCVLTIEDPVEYELTAAGHRIGQTQVNARKGITFSTGLRHLLRQDPDVILVGEIRDVETARASAQASLTGHLVLSTLHTSDAATAVARLLDLQLEPSLVASTLSTVLAQRLVRRLHAPGPREARRRDQCMGSGCALCSNSGFLGRTGIFELLITDEPIRHAIHARASTHTIRQLALQAGMRTLQDQGRELLAQGLTNSDELARALGPADASQAVGRLGQDHQP